MPTRNRRMRWSPPLLLRVVRARPRLFLSGAVGAVLTLALAGLTDWRPVTRLLAGWDIGVTLYLTLAFHMMAGLDVHRIRRRAAQHDQGQRSMLVLTIAAALASLAAIFAEL